METNNELPVKNKRRKVLFWSIGSTLFVLLVAAMLFFNLFGVYAAYIYIFKIESIPKGANLYVSEKIINSNDGATALLALRMVRPMTIQEVQENPLYSEKEKLEALIIANDYSLTPHLQMMNVFFEIDDMKKDHNFLLGVYSETKILRTVNFNSNSFLATTYVVEPNEKYLEDMHFTADMPIGYTYANKMVYIDPSYASTASPVIK